MKDDLISVIVPVYKVEKYLEKCIDSIINQTYKNIEIILVDDGSPDNCGNICDEYEKKYSTIKVIHKENGGLSDARNRGIEIATGDYIAFVDSDDYIDKCMYEKLYKSIKKHDADIAMCNCACVDENDNITNKNKTFVFKYETLPASKCMDEINSSWVYIVAWNKLYKRKALKGIKFPLNRINEDEFVIHHILYNCKLVSFVNEKLYKYVQRESSIMNKSISVKRFDIVDAIYDRYIFYNENNIEFDKKVFFSNLTFKYCKIRAAVKAKTKQERKRIHEADRLYKKMYLPYCRGISEKLKVLLPRLRFLKIRIQNERSI